MKLPQPYKCDYCTNKKAETNHWWLLITPEPDRFLLLPWDNAEADHDGVKHICSESCASKALSQYMLLTSANTRRVAGERSKHEHWIDTICDVI